MVVRTTRRDEGCRFVISPNRSLTWQQTKLVYASLAGVCLIVALAFTFMGYWLVLPFAGAEVVALAVGFYLCALSGRDTEVVSIKNDRIAIDKGRQRLRRVWELDRLWAQIELRPARIQWYPSQLLIRSHGKQLQLGAFLTDQERERLARALKRAIASEEGGCAYRDEGEATLI